MVTGGASEIGRAAALCCSHGGPRVAVVDLDQRGVESCMQEIEGSGGQAKGFRVDVQEEDQVRRLFTELGGWSDRINGQKASLQVDVGVCPGGLA